MQVYGILMRREILLSGTGWIGAGIVCIAVWGLEAGNSVCSCPSLLAGIPTSSISVQCHCSNPVGLLYTGIFVIAVGAALFLLNKRIEKMMDRYVSNARKERHGHRVRAK
jgi:hypothetical protein